MFQYRTVEIDLKKYWKSTDETAMQKNLCFQVYRIWLQAPTVFLRTLEFQESFKLEIFWMGLVNWEEYRLI